MRTVTIGSKEVGLKATPLALLFYKQEFGADLIGDLVTMKNIGEDLSSLDTVLIMQLVWAMAKAHTGPGKAFSNFEKWLESLDFIDFADEKFLLSVMEEAEQGFFRGGGKSGHPATKK